MTFVRRVWWQSSNLQQCRKYINQRGEASGRDTSSWLVRQRDNQRNSGCKLKVRYFAPKSVFTQLITMIAPEDHSSAVPQPCLL